MISDKAIIDPCCYIGDNVSVGPFTVIHANVEIRSGTRIGSHCVIGSPAESRFVTKQLGVVIGEDCVIGNHVTIDRGTEKDTWIDRECFICVGTQIAHDVYMETKVTIAGNCMIAGFAYLMKGVTIGQNASIGQKVTIGSCTMISQGTHIARNILPGRKIIGIIEKDVGPNPLGQRRMELTDFQLANEHERWQCLTLMHSKKI